MFSLGSDIVQIGHGSDGSNVLATTFNLSDIEYDEVQVLHALDGPTVVLGLQHMKNASLGPPSLFSHFRKEGLMTSFSYCANNEGDHRWTWNDKTKKGTQILVSGEMHWAVPLKHMKQDP